MERDMPLERRRRGRNDSQGPRVCNGSYYCHLLLLGMIMTTATAFTSSSYPTSFTSSVQRYEDRNRLLTSLSVATSTTQVSSPSFKDTTTTNIHLPSPDDDDIDNREDVPSLGTIMKMLPKEVFDIDTPTSLFYFGVDFVAVVSCLTFLYSVVTSASYQALPLFAQALSVIPLQILSGFSMWCMWCIGHDAGHGTVSKSNAINNIVGEIAHSIFCLTPFVPWKKSHLKHHLNHNHLTRDYSHQWFIREEYDDLHPLFKLSHKTRNAQLPILYLVYLLLGIPDGGHVYFYGRLWKDEPLSEKLRASVSSIVSLATAFSLWNMLGTADFAVVIFAPWLVLSFWLFMVTYLQHHSDDGKLYTDDTWTFTKGAFQTVDRSYGKWINRMSHHMMDGHVAHHLFFTKVPHYRLELATTKLKENLTKGGWGHLYKQIDTPDFTQEIVKQFDENWFFINEKQVVRTDE